MPSKPCLVSSFLFIFGPGWAGGWYWFHLITRTMHFQYLSVVVQYYVVFLDVLVVGFPLFFFCSNSEFSASKIKFKLHKIPLPYGNNWLSKELNFPPSFHSHKNQLFKSWCCRFIKLYFLRSHIPYFWLCAAAVEFLHVNPYWGPSPSQCILLSVSYPGDMKSFSVSA